MKKIIKKDKHFLLISLYLLLFESPVFSAQYHGVLNYPGAIGLTSPTTGIVIESNAAGGFFSAGDKLVIFDSSVLKSQIYALNIELHLQKKVYAEAKREFQRSEELYEGSMLSDHELKMAEISQLNEKKLLEILKSKLIKLSWNLKYSTVKAPYDGYLVFSNTFAGQYINNHLQAKAIVSFVSSQNILLHILFSNAQLSAESKLMKLEKGDKVQIQPLLAKETESSPLYRGEFIALVNDLSLAYASQGSASQGNKVLILKLLGNGEPKKPEKLPLNNSLIKLLIK